MKRSVRLAVTGYVAIPALMPVSDLVCPV